MPPIDDPRVQPALDAMLSGDAARLEAALTEDPALATERWGENTLLEWTTQPPHGVADEVIEVLVDRSPSLDRALNLAGCWNLPSLCQRLIAAGADVTARASAGITPLESAAMHSATDAADVLVRHGLHRPSLWLAAACGLTETVGGWIDDDGVVASVARETRPDWADVGRPDHGPVPSDDAALLDEAFVFAALNDRLETAELLLDRGASVDAGPWANTTALHFAIQFHRLRAVEFLLDRGAATTVEDDVYRSTAIGWAHACATEGDPTTAAIIDLLQPMS